MSSRAPTHLIQPPSLADSVLKGAGQRIPNKMQRIQEVTLARAILSHQIGQRLQTDIAIADAFEISKHDALDENGILHNGDFR